MIVYEGRFKSFVDVEMSRYANAVFFGRDGAVYGMASELFTHAIFN